MDKPRLKICQLSTVDFGLYHFLTPLMRRMREEGHEVIGACADGELADRVREDGFRVEAIPFERSLNIFRHAQSYFALVDFFLREQFDIVHVHTPIAALIARPAAARAGVPTIVYTAHGFYFHEHQPWLVRRILILLEWIAGRYTDVLFTQSVEDANSARYHRLCRGNVIEPIGNGVDTSTFHPISHEDDRRSRTRLREEYGANDNTVVVLMVGRLVAEKGYRELFEAFEDLPECVHLWVVGSRLESDHAASIGDAITAIRRDEQRRRRVKFLGYRQDVDIIMRAVDIFVLPSHREGMPRSIIEAMMTGLPVVATDIRGCREEVVDGETGFLVPVRQPAALKAALLELASDKALRGSMGIAGQKRAIALYDERTVIDRQLRHLGIAGELSESGVR